MSNIGKYVIVRGSKSGVFAGILKERNGREVELADCRRLWEWQGACSISQIAVDGTKEPDRCRFSITVDSIEIFDVIEVIPCTEEAERVIRSVEVWKK